MAEPLTKRAVVAAARDMIESDGLDALSLRKLAASLGVTAPALYAHVGSKRELLQAVAEDVFTEVLDRFRGIPEGDPLMRIRSMSAQYVSYAREHPHLFRTMFLFRPELTSQPSGRELPLATEAFNFAVGAVGEAIDEGLLDRSDPLMAGLVIWTAVHGVATILLAGPEFGSEIEDELLSAVVDTVLAGMERSGSI